VPTKGYSRVTVGEDETVAVDPLGVLGVELHEAGPEDVSGRGETLKWPVSHRATSDGDGVGLTIGAPGCPELAWGLDQHKALPRVTSEPTHLGDDIGGEGTDGAETCQPTGRKGG
jgi:hypothetical protein